MSAGMDGGGDNALNNVEKSTKITNNMDMWNAAVSIAPLDKNLMTSLQQMETMQHVNVKPMESVSDFKVITANQIDEFLKCHKNLILQNKVEVKDDALEFFEYLSHYHKSYLALTEQIAFSIADLNKLAEYRKQVCENTDSLDQTSRQLVAVQTHLTVLNDQLHQELAHYVGFRMVSQKLVSKMLIVGSEAFNDVLRRIDGGIVFMMQNPDYKQSAYYLKQYKSCQKIAIAMIRRFVILTLNSTTEKIASPAIKDAAPDDETASGIDPAISFYYGKFQALAYKIQPLIRDLETRADKSTEYAELLRDIQISYIDNRFSLLNSSITNSVRNLAEKNKNDRSVLFRTACSLFLQLCQYEHQLYFVFFTRHTPNFRKYLQQICVNLYDTLRPFIVHIEHIEILCELCTMLKRDMLENVDANREALEPFGEVVTDILRDLQERLVFRAHIYFRTNILEYQPAPGDLAYPEKLYMIRDILQSNPPKSVLVRTDSAMSIESGYSNRSRAPELSHTDLQGMWYPTVRRTLQCLSQLYRCVDISTFQGLSQEAISFCVQSISVAANAISEKSSVIDGDLFQIKHLLILREQIASFQVDFTVKETSLDFSKVREAASDLFHRKNLFTMNSSNAILKFILDGTPEVKEQLLDSKKDADYQLKEACQRYIIHATIALTEPLATYLKKVSIYKQSGEFNIKKFRTETWSQPEEVAKVVAASKRSIKARFLPTQQTLTLYINNKETEAILFRPIKNNTIAAFVQLEQCLAECFYEKDELLVISCPTPEQVSLFLSSASLLHASTSQQETSEHLEENKQPNELKESSGVSSETNQLQKTSNSNESVEITDPQSVTPVHEQSTHTIETGNEMIPLSTDLQHQQFVPETTRTDNQSENEPENSVITSPDSSAEIKRKSTGAIPKRPISKD